MSETNNQLAQDELIGALKEKADARGYKKDIPSFEEVTVGDIDFQVGSDGVEVFDRNKFLSELGNANGNAYNPYQINVPEKGLKGKIKNSIRYLLSFIIAPIVEHQNNFNTNIIHCMNQVRNYVGSGDQEKFFDQQEKLTEELETRIMVLEKRISELEEEIKQRGGEQ